MSPLDTDDQQDTEIEYIESVVVQGKCLAVDAAKNIYLNGQRTTYRHVERLLGHTMNTMKRRLDRGHKLCKVILPVTDEYWTDEAKTRSAEIAAAKSSRHRFLSGIGLVGDRSPMSGVERLYCDLLRMPL